MIYLSIIIPTYNEAPNLDPLIGMIQSQHFNFEYEIILIDSGSSDGSKEIIHRLESTHPNIKAHFLDRNFGKGFCVREGLKFAAGEIILIQDADLEYSPSDYHKLLAAFQSTEINFVLGSRSLGARTWRYRTQFRRSIYLEVANVGSEFLSQIFRLLYRSDISDTQTMFKVFRRDLLNDVTLSSNGFDLDWEILCKLVRRGQKPLEIPVSYRARTIEEGKKLRLFKDGLAALVALVRFRFVE